MTRLTQVMALGLLLVAGPAAADVVAYLRFATAYGRLEGDTIVELAGAPYDGVEPTGRTFRRAEVRLLPPAEPSKVLAVGLNYRSHAGGRAEPGLFAKLPSALIGPDDAVVIPPDATNVHYEGELVVVIGKRARRVPVTEAPAHVFAVTAGNDVSERGWQGRDLQWLRAKASDTFGPVGPIMVAGLDFDDLMVQTRVNGETRQAESTKGMTHSVAEIVSFASRYFTLEPGDMILTGTPGQTQALAPGDVVEVEVEGVGVLRNPVVAGR